MISRESIDTRENWINFLWKGEGEGEGEGLERDEVRRHFRGTDFICKHKFRGRIKRAIGDVASGLLRDFRNNQKCYLATNFLK